MSSVSQGLARTVKTNIAFYATDNKGRDTYISYNNGGFWKDNIKQIKLKANFPRYMYKNFHSLNHQAAPFNYYSDGTGRDTYVIKDNAGLVKEFTPLANRQILSQYLRKNMPISYKKKPKNIKLFLTPSYKQYFLKSQNIQKKVVHRLYNQCLEKFKQRMKSSYYNSKDSLKNFFNIQSEGSLVNDSNKKSSQTLTRNNSLNNKTKKKIFKKMNKTMNDFYHPTIKDHKISSLKTLKINDSNLDNFSKNNYYYTINHEYKNNEKDKLNTITKEIWNPILNNFIKSKVDNNGRKVKKEEKKINLSETEKYNLMKSKNLNQKPRRFKLLFEKSQILNGYKPFLLDEFHDYKSNGF